MKITLHETLCVASGNCGFVAPKVFSNPEDNGGFVELNDSTPPESEWDAASEAEFLCPSKTIQIDRHQIPPR